MSVIHSRFTMKQGAKLVAGCAVLAMIATLPSSRLYFMGASQFHIKSGNWVEIGPDLQLTEARFESIVNAVNARGDVACMRISNPSMTNSAFVHVAKLKSLVWLYIEDAPISDRSLDGLRRLTNLTQLHIDRCPNLSLSAINQLHNDLPGCSIHIDEYTTSASMARTGARKPDEPSSESNPAVSRDMVP